MMSLRERMEERKRLLAVQQMRCERCLKIIAVPEDTKQKLQSLCDGCFGFDEQRRQEQKNGVPGGQSSSEAFENSDFGNHFQTGVEIGRTANVIGCRSDVRWYKKAGGNGDG
jgi:hypothetical protein